MRSPLTISHLLLLTLKRTKKFAALNFFSSIKISLPAITLLLLIGFQAKAVDPIVTVRFANPEYVCSTQTYSLDVEFQCNITSKQLFGMNVRFFYPDNVLEFISFGEFVSGYSAVSPNPPIISTGNASSGTVLFGFPGPQEYVNGAIQKTGSTTLTISTTGWTKIFNVSFHVDDPNAMNSESFCPSVIWDLNEAATGGINPSGGIIITVVNSTPPPESANAIEHCAQFNWQYDGIPGLPHGFPVSTNCINTICAYAPETHLPIIGLNTQGVHDIPVTVIDFDNIGSFCLVFEYDPAVMTYVSHTPNAIFTPANGLLNVTDSVSTDGKKKITLYYQGVAISLSDNAHLTDLQFDYLSGSSDLTWMITSNSCWYADANDLPVYDLPFSDYYINGLVASSLAPTTKIDSVVAVSGDLVTFAVTVWNFTDIQSGILTLSYDADVLVFQDAIPNTAISGSFIETDTPGNLEMEWQGEDISLADNSVLIYVTFHYLGGSAPLTWYDNGASCQYISSNLMIPLSDEPSENFYINGNMGNAVFIWTGENSEDWDTETNWIDNVTPDQYINVVIDPATDPLNWPTYEGDFTLGENCKNLTLNDNAIMTITGDLTINPGHTLNLNGSGTLYVGGNWVNSGIFIPGNGIVEFTGDGDAYIAEGIPPGNFIAAFILSTFTADMIPITGGLAGPSGNDAHSDVNIGFDFNYLGTSYSQVRINTNGWLALSLTGNDELSFDNTALFSTSTPTTALAPWWDDLNADAGTTIAYLTEGTAPFRVFTVEWKNILAYSSEATTRLNFQVKLYESSNIIEFYYGNVISGSHNTAEGASIGIKDAIGGTGNFIEATQNSTNIILAFLKSNTNWPTENYRFTPPVPSEMEVFHKIIVSKSSGKLQIQKDVNITGVD
jgi:hypothetical protein